MQFLIFFFSSSPVYFDGKYTSSYKVDIRQDHVPPEHNVLNLQRVDQSGVLRCSLWSQFEYLSII